MNKVVKIDEMNIFGSRKEAVVTAVIAAFFVLTALAMTFEPLVTVILKTRTMPAYTNQYLTADPVAKSADFFDGIMKNVPPSHGWVGNVALLNKVKDLVFNLNIVSATVQNNSVAIEAANDPEQTVADIRRFLSKLTPFEIKTILPDETSMIETVIDPDLIKVVQNGPSWSFTQTNPQLIIEKNGSNSSIYINYPQAVDTHGFETPISCSTQTDGIKTLKYDATRSTLLSATFKGFLAYLKDYSCFQSFSTLNW